MQRCRAFFNTSVSVKSKHRHERSVTVNFNKWTVSWKASFSVASFVVLLLLLFVVCVLFFVSVISFQLFLLI